MTCRCHPSARACDARSAVISEQTHGQTGMSNQRLACLGVCVHKRCSTIERNTTKMVATIKSVTCPLALCKKPGRRFWIIRHCHGAVAFITHPLVLVVKAQI